MKTPTLQRDTDIQIWESQKNSGSFNQKEKKISKEYCYDVLKHEITTTKRILKTVTEKHKITYKAKPIRLAADFPTGTLQAVREGDDTFN